MDIYCIYTYVCDVCICVRGTMYTPYTLRASNSVDQNEMYSDVSAMQTWIKFLISRNNNCSLSNRISLTAIHTYIRIRIACRTTWHKMKIQKQKEKKTKKKKEITENKKNNKRKMRKWTWGQHKEGSISTYQTHTTDSIPYASSSLWLFCPRTHCKSP